MIDLSVWKYSKGHSIWLIQIQRMEASLRMSFFCKMSSWQPKLLHKRGRLMLWFYYTYFLSLAGSRWKIVSTGSDIIWFWPRVQNPEGVQEDLGGGPGKPRGNSTCPAAAQLPFLQKFHPQAFGCLPGILTPWNLEILKSWNREILHTREKLILRMYKVKVAVVGPSQAGKTMISNFLADATENIGGDISASVFVLCKLCCFWNGCARRGNKALLQGNIDQP